MAPRKLLTVGLDLASEHTEFAEFESRVSLLDWDIVVFSPDISNFIRLTRQTYLGKPSLAEAASFRLRESCEHWRRELKQAVESGKTIVVLLSPLQEVFIDTGERKYSGTGRNQKTTRMVRAYSNYESIPARLLPILSQGKGIVLTPQRADVLSTFWSEFGEHSRYQVLLTAPDIPTCFTTKSGGKSVGALFRTSGSVGSLLLLPDIEFPVDDVDEFDDLVDDEDEAEELDQDCELTEAEQFAERMVSALVALDKSLRSDSEITPEPAWAADVVYTLAAERALQIQLLEAETEVEVAQRRKEKIADELRASQTLRGLLYEKGKPLENALIKSLVVLGFSAAGFKDAESEFDVVFECDRGRLIGEAEGKDSKAVNIEKLRQLAMNVHEDLQRSDVKEPAKAVLFGNSYRLSPVAERAEPFTEKCLKAAASTSTALVFTPDLFVVVQYLSEQNDSDFLRRCQDAILSAAGRVMFPEAPAVGSSSDASEIAME